MPEIDLLIGEDHKMDAVVTKLTGIGLVEVPQRFGRAKQETMSVDWDSPTNPTRDGSPGKWLSQHLDINREAFVEDSAEDTFWNNLRAVQDSLAYDVDDLRAIADMAKLSAKEVEIAELIMSGSPVSGPDATNRIAVALDVSDARVRGLLSRVRAKLELYWVNQEA